MPSKAAKKKATRSKSWKSAKKRGHDLEKWLAKQLRTNEAFSEWLSEKCGKGKSKGRAEAYAGGRHADKVMSVFGDYTPSKADVAVHLDPPVLVSVKMSKGGQVWLVTVERFVGVFRRIIGKQVPKAAHDGLTLFFGPLTASQLQSANSRSKLSAQERHQKRLNAKSMRAAYPKQYSAMTEWLTDNLSELVRLAFGRGLAKNKSDAADFVWYVTKGKKFDITDPGTSSLFAIDELVAAIRKVPSNQRLAIGTKNGGTAFATPFGHIQMHKHQIQFHHSKDRVTALIKGD